MGCLHLRLKQIQQGIIKAVFVAQGLGHLDVEVHDLFKVGLKVGVVGFGPGLNPGFLSQGGCPGHLGDQPGWNLPLPLVVAGRNAYQASLVGIVVEVRCLCFELFEQVTDLIADEESVSRFP